MNTKNKQPKKTLRRAADSQLENVIIDYNFQPNLATGIYGNIDGFGPGGVGGWLLNFAAPEAPITIHIKLGDMIIGSGKTNSERPDIASLANVTGQFGFHISWNLPRLAMALATYDDEEVAPISVSPSGDSRSILSPTPPRVEEIRQWLKASGHYALSLKPHSSQWLRAVGSLPSSNLASENVKGYLEAAMASDVAEISIVVGWLVSPPETVTWLEDNTGSIYPIESSYRFFRQDVYDSVAKEIGSHTVSNGFIAKISTPKKHDILKLKALTETGIHTLAEIKPGKLSADPVSAARWLFALNSPISEFAKRTSQLDSGLLAPLITNNSERFTDLPTRQVKLGSSPDTPLVSIIIPLYGRTDFVEHQFLEFSRDQWLQENTEIIFVLDDPKIVEKFHETAQTLHRLYKIPFTWVWGSANRGFSGANNLGVTHSRGQYLLFLNSDVFPQTPGWLESLLSTLKANKNIGAVGPRLTFASGSIQHAGMEFKRKEELGIWINNHPNMGLDPLLDPYHELTLVPAITGACLLMRRQDFERIEGWDTGYLIGDFEDSDLCLKLRSAGLEIAYQPDVQLTHLERQSFKLLGQDDFRTRVVIYNAARHQQRWESLIESSELPSTAN